jgi:hypothetical protein
MDDAPRSSKPRPSKPRPSKPRPSRKNRNPFTRGWIVAILAVVLVAVHGLVLNYVLSHVLTSMAAAAGIVVLIVIVHAALLRGNFRRCRQ